MGGREKLGPAVGLKLGLLLWLETLVLFVNKGEKEEVITLNSVPDCHPRKVPFTNGRNFLETLSQHSDSRRSKEVSLPEDRGAPFVKAAIRNIHSTKR